MPDRIIAVFHSRNPDPGKVRERLAARGFEIDGRSPCHGDTLPADLSGYTAAIVFGGPQSANDDHDPGIRVELDWIEDAALPSGLPVLGICLGARQIARVLRARIGRTIPKSCASADTVSIRPNRTLYRTDFSEYGSSTVQSGRLRNGPARIGPHPDGLVEIGYCEVRPTGRCPRSLTPPPMPAQPGPPV